MNAEHRPLAYQLSSIEEIIEDARNGRIFILVDDENRENEGDFIIPAQMATPEVINFMAQYGRGLICLSLTKQRIDELNLDLMPSSGTSHHETAFTTSIEAREGVTTGISAPDRAHTISTAINSKCGPDQITTPGHVFPLVARDGGVLIRAGHTEASVDIARMAGLNPSAVICEIMNMDGTMSRFSDLIGVAREHKLNIGSIADLIAYRRKTEKLVEKLVSSRFESQFGGIFNISVYKNCLDNSEHIVLFKGDWTEQEAIPVRMHSLNVFSDVIGDIEHGSEGMLQRSMQYIDEYGKGIIVLIRDPEPNVLSRWVEQHNGENKPHKIGELRDYGLGAQILKDMKVGKIRLIINSDRAIVGIDGFEVQIIERLKLS